MPITITHAAKAKTAQVRVRRWWPAMQAFGPTAGRMKNTSMLSVSTIMATRLSIASSSGMGTGLTTAVMPSTSKMFNTFEPITVPSASSD